MKKVIFISSRPLGRCENITAVYNALNDNYVDKVFDRMWDRTSDILHDPNAQYDLVVTDELVKESKAPVIMIYHGGTGCKTGLLQRPRTWDTPGIEAGSKILSYAICSADSQEAINITAEQCGISPDRVLPLGIPRLDKYINRPRPEKTGKHTYLYVPTYRRLNDVIFADIDLYAIDSILTDNETLLVKPHMIFKGKMPENHHKHIKFLSKDEPSEDYIFNSDVLITDYSTIMLDAHAMGVPVVLFEKDSDRYLKDPGMCLEYPNSYTSRHTQNEEELISLCRSAVLSGPGKEDLECKELLTNMCDGNATKRLCDLINDILEGKR